MASERKYDGRVSLSYFLRQVNAIMESGERC